MMDLENGRKNKCESDEGKSSKVARPKVAGRRRHRYHRAIR